ncbi:MAG: IS1096 element passenger TnpR family protein [Gemmatimonadaceae bacterium]
MPKTSTRHPSPPICELRVELLGEQAGAWRVIRLSAGVLLPRLSRVLLAALGWFKADDWWFEAAQIRYREPNAHTERTDAGTVRLRHILPDTGTEALYVVGLDRAEWRHRLTIDRLLTPSPDLRAPVCLAGRGTVPTGNARASGFDVRVTNAELKQLTTRG